MTCKKIKGYWISLYWCWKDVPVSILGTILLFTNRLESKLSNEHINIMSLGGEGGGRRVQDGGHTRIPKADSY